MICYGEKMKKTCFFFVLTFFLGQLMSNEDIRINQLGYYPRAIKRFVVANSTATTFQIHDLKGKTVYEGKLMDRGLWKTSNEYVKTGDFSSFQKPGKYRIYIKDKGKSFQFKIKDHLYREALKASLKSRSILEKLNKLQQEFNISSYVGFDKTTNVYYINVYKNRSNLRSFWSLSPFEYAVIKRGKNVGRLRKDVLLENYEKTMVPFSGDISGLRFES